MPRELMLALAQGITAFSLVLLIAEILFVVANLLLKKRKERIAFLRSFKDGKFAIIYLTALPLWWVGHLYAEEGPIEAFFYTINEILSLVVMKYEVSSISALMGDNDAYKYTVYLCFVMVVLNAVLFAFSLTMQHIWNGIQAVRALLTRRNKLYLFGNNEGNLAIYKSDKKRAKVIIDDLTEQDCEKLYMDKVAYIKSPSLDAQTKNLLKLVKRLDREYIFVVNTGKDDKNISVCRSVIDFIDGSSEQLRDRLFLNLKVYVFGDPQYQAIYEDIVSGAHGCIHYVNKYQKVAMDLIDRYPLSLFMDGEQVDYETSLIRENVDINVLLVGFGRTNQQIFLASVANNQFLTAGDGDPVLKPVKYFIFDNTPSENNKNLNHSYYRYKRELDRIDPEDFLPLPSVPAEEAYFHMDINDAKFYEDIRDICSRNKKDANFVIIAFGNDLENLDMAQKLVEKRREWGLDNLKIFVRSLEWRKEQTLLDDPNCFFIGNETECVYNVNKLLSDKIFRMAKMRNEVYDLEYDMTKEDAVEVNDQYVAFNRSRANRKWYRSKSQMERDSSLYACLSLRSKLNLMGLDYCEKSENGEALTEEEYMQIYAGNDRPNTEKYGLRADGKSIVYYSIDFAASRRKTMAIHEHQRWNSFMISRGMIPATREQILSETKTNGEGEVEFTNGKNYSLRRHGNLTTFDGLAEFRRIVARRDQKPEEKKDVIKYDYQLLDDAYWLLSQNGYKIIRKK